jgi:predicted transcriptional regulator YdeE
MKHFMIKYQFANGTTEQWHQEIAKFIAALNNDSELKNKISYRCMKNRDDDSYTHLAAATDEQAIKTLQARDFFKHYTERTRQVAGGDVVVTPMELIAETAQR